MLHQFASSTLRRVWRRSSMNRCLSRSTWMTVESMWNPLTVGCSASPHYPYLLSLFIFSLGSCSSDQAQLCIMSCQVQLKQQVTPSESERGLNPAALIPETLHVKTHYPYRFVQISDLTSASSNMRGSANSLSCMLGGENAAALKAVQLFILCVLNLNE